MSASKATGNLGEDHAVRFLQSKGMQVIETQWRCRVGEIDVVVRDGPTIVFVEVKTRHGQPAGEALMAITPTKRERIIAAAYAYIAEAGLDDPAWRVDAVAVTIARDGSVYCTHVENVLDW